MYTLLWRSTSFLVFGLILVSVALLVPPSTSVRADVGIQPILPDGSNIQPDVETPIQMASERVVFYVRQATEWDATSVTQNPMAYGLQGPEWNPTLIFRLSVAEVSAVFTMTNPTSQAVSMTVWFPLASALESEEWENHIGEVAPRIENFEVSVNGQPLAYEVSELPNPKGADAPLLPWASFPVTFPAGQDTLIEVSYLIWAQEDITGVGMSLSYIFQTGAGWAGSIGHAELIINLPYIASPETINVMPEGGQMDGCQVRWTWEDFEPGAENDFNIWLIRQERWEELETARMNVVIWPDDGERWLDLADTYRRLILGKYATLPGFGETFYPLGIQAAQEALRLLPDDGRPHYQLAFFYLAALPENPTRENLAPLLEELRLVAGTANEGDIRDWIEYILSSEMWASLSEEWATQTAVAMQQIPSETVAPLPALTTTLVPGPTVTPLAEVPSAGQNVVIILVVGLIGGVVGYLVGNRRR